VTLRPWASPKIYNAIFTDFNERGVLLDTQQGVTATQSVTGAYAQFHNTLWWDFVTGSGNQEVSNTATNLGRSTVATSYWTDASLSNQIANPLLTSISRTNVGAFLDPRPAPGSPAYSDYASTPNDGFLTPANYRGAFGGGRANWASDWTALGEYGLLTGAGGFIPQHLVSNGGSTPAQPTLAASHSGGNIAIVFGSQSGNSYQLQAATNLPNGPITWVSQGNPVPGTGDTLTIMQPIQGVEQYFRVLVQ
jgi:hypothetical protein